MKKLLSMILILSIVWSCLGTVGVSAEAADSELIYDMDLSGFAASGVIGNDAGSDSCSFELTQETTGTVTADAFINQNKADVPYIAMTHTDAQLAYQSTETDMLGKSYTMEAWVQFKETRPGTFPGNAYGRPFMTILSNGVPTSYGGEDNANLMVRLADCTNKVSESEGNTTHLAWGGRYKFAWLSTEYNHNDWLKFTVVRDVVTEGETTKIVKRLYINGSKNYVGRNGSYSELTYETDASYAETAVSFGLGNVEIAFEEFNIADVKLYKGVRTEDEIAADYENEKDSYTKAELSDFLVYEMDLSEYTAENKKVTDKVSGTPSTVNGAPVLNKSGNQNYLTFRTVYAERENAVTVTDEDFANQDEMSFEFWFRGTELKSGGAESRICSLATGNTNGDIRFEIYNSPSGNFWFRMNGLKSDGTEDTAHRMSKNMNDYNEKWTHVVFTRTWQPTADDGTEGKWYGELYINGAKTQTATSSAAVTRADETGIYLTIGNKSSNTTAFYGDIATFKVYNTILNQDEVTQNYESSIEAFDAGEISLSFTNGADDSEVTYLDEVSQLKVTYANVSMSATAYVAQYDLNGRLLQVVSQAAAEDGVVSLDITEDTYKVCVFVLEQNTMQPLIPAAEIGYSDNYKSRVTAESAFYNAGNAEIDCLKGEESVTVKASCSSFMPPQSVRAELSYTSDGEITKTESCDVSFVNGKAAASLTIDGIVPKAGDVATFRLYADSKVIYAKTLGYEDLSKIVDVLLVAGQSNAMGQGGTAAESIKTEPDTVYYQTMGNNALTSGNPGWDASLGKTWHEETGHTVLIVKAAWGATGFPTMPNLETGALSQTGSDKFGRWDPANGGGDGTVTWRDCYTTAKNYYNAAIASIDTAKYTIGDCVYFWNQGENENRTYTAEMYEESFMELHNAFLTEFGSGEAKLTYGGILPVRATTDSAPANLGLTGPRIAQYKMAQEQDDLYLVSDATEHWYSDSSIAQWFEAESGYYYAETPDAWTDVMNADNLHYTQLAMNELGREAAKNMLNYLAEGREVTGIELITPTGIRKYNNGDSIYLPETAVIPRLSSASGKKASYAITAGNGAELKDGLLIAKAALLNNETILTVTVEGQSPMTFKLYSPILDESTIAIAPIKDNKKAIYTLTADDGYAYTNQYLDKKFKELGLVGTMGLVPAYIDSEEEKIAQDAGAVRKYLTWSEAEELINCENSVWGVANHTQNHKQGEFLQLTEEQLETEINGGRQTLRSHFPQEKILALFTPGGQRSDTVVNKVKENHLLLRIVSGFVQTVPTTVEGRYKMPGHLVQSTTTAQSMNSWVDTAISQGGWLVELWHGVGDTDSAGSGLNLSEDAADTHLKYVAEKQADGSLWVTTMDEAAVYTVQREHTKIELVTNEPGSMVFSLTDELADDIYDSELTVNVTLPAGAADISVKCGNETVTYTATENGISFNVLPNHGQIEISYT